jgi:hypothetical protein
MQAPVTMTKQSKVDKAREAASWLHIASTSLYEYAALVNKGVSGRHNLEPSIVTARNGMLKAALIFATLGEEEPKNPVMSDEPDNVFRTRTNMPLSVVENRPTPEKINAELLAACKAMREELRLIRTKDSDAVYDVMCRTEADIAIARAEREAAIAMAEGR